MKSEKINIIAKNKKPIIYCDYCQHDLRTEGLVCHDSKTQTNFYGNYFIMMNGKRVDYYQQEKKINSQSK
ncbi:MAG: hypothetical protein MRERV_9c007 [Mycoplasmataceae bacterium RV_VA103A]|nr:MAG: hypothetical protein MRERV_9c007 [Mycoplasmataceae bacterium RV_VA103A]